MRNRKLSTVALAAAAAAWFAAGIGTAAAAEGEQAKVKCEGVNACKGKSACGTADHACAGQNACAGKGWVEMTKAECDAAKAKQAEKATAGE